MANRRLEWHPHCTRARGKAFMWNPKSKLVQIPCFVPFDFSFFSSFQRPEVSQDHSHDSFYSFPWKAKGKQTCCVLIWILGHPFFCDIQIFAFFSTHSAMSLFLKVSSNILSSHFFRYAGTWGISGLRRLAEVTNNQNIDKDSFSQHFFTWKFYNWVTASRACIALAALLAQARLLPSNKLIFILLIKIRESILATAT